MTKIGLIAFLTFSLTFALSADTLPPLTDGAPQTFDALWKGFDPQKEPLDVEVLHETEEDGVVIRVIRYRVAMFNGKKAMMAAIYGYPQTADTGSGKLPGLIHLHGGGQYAHSAQVVANAKRGYATISLAWYGNLIAPGYTVNKDNVKAFKTGNTNDPNYRVTTDWVGVDAPTPSEHTIDPVKSPRNTLWSYAGMGCRRALTFLERQKEVDGNRLGVFGHSMGGKLTVLTAGSDKRVKAAAPSCGGVSDIRKVKNIPGYATTIDDDVYLKRITCPIVFQSPANDFHAAVDDLTLAANLVKSKEWRITSAAHINHNDLEENTILQPLWFDQFLKGTFEMVQTPRAELILKTESGIPRFEVKPDQPGKVTELNVYYTEEGIPGGRERYHEFPARNWKVAPAERHGDTWVAEIPTFSSDNHLWVYANAKYPIGKTVSSAGYGCDIYTANDYVLSTLMSMVTPQQKKDNGVKATQEHSLVIEDFEGDWDNRWFYTRGGHPDYWALKTFKALSPMHMPPASARLVVDARSKEDNSLVISTFSSWDGGQEQRTYKQTIKGGNQWQTISLLPSDLRDKQNTPLSDWSEMKKLQLSGPRPRPELRNLHWKKVPLRELMANREMKLDKAQPVDGRTYLDPKYADQFTSALKVVMNKSCAGHPLAMGDKTYEQGIGTHAPSRGVFFLGGRYKTFHAEVGIQKHQPGSLRLRVRVDKEDVYDSGIMRQNSAPKTIALDLAGAFEMELIVDNAGDNSNGDHGNWCNAYLTKSVTGALQAKEYHVSKAGRDVHSGSKSKPFLTISKAAEVAQPGDTIIVHEGVYREAIDPPRGGSSDEKRIVYQAAKDETVTIKGSERVQGWTKLDEEVWSVTLPNSFFGDYNPFGEQLRGNWYEAKRPYHTAAVYLNGHWLHEAPRKSVVVKSSGSGGVKGDSRQELMNISWMSPGSTKGGESLNGADYVKASDPLKTAQLEDGKKYIGRILDGMMLTYDIQFGEEATHMGMGAASPLEGGLVEVRLDSAEGELLGTFDVGFTAEWDTFQAYSAVFKRPVSGRQRVVLVFRARAQRKIPADQAHWFAEVSEKDTTIWAQFRGVDPNEELVDVNVRRTVFYPEKPGMNYITVRGFTLEQAAPPWAPPTAQQIGLIGTHWSKGWVIENNTIRYSVCTGVSLGKGWDKLENKQNYHGTIALSLNEKGWRRENIGHHVVRNNHIYNCGQGGINGSLGCAFSTITGNEIHDIKTHHNYGGCETAGIKLHGFVDGIISHNHVYNCAHWGGIWLDWMGQGARITSNLLHDNSQDLMLEVNHGPVLVDNNLFLSGKVLTKASDGMAFVNNLLFANLSVWPADQRATPIFEAHSTKLINRHARILQDDDRFYNNLFVGGKGTSFMDEHGFATKAVDNVYVADKNPGSNASKHDERALVDADFDPEIKLEKNEQGEWWLDMKVDPGWNKDSQRQFITTEILGLPKVTRLPFEHRDGAPYRIDTDYFGKTRQEKFPSPGPLEFSDPVKNLRVKVWPPPLFGEAADAPKKWTPEQIGWECFPLKPDRTLEYKTVTGTNGAPVELKLQVFLPEGWQVSDQRPAAVLFHGGGWYGGGPDHYYPQSRYLALRGMVAISVEYRTINRFGTTPKECVADGKSAMRWIKTHAAEVGIDPERIVAGGGSAGGHIAAAVALVSAFDEPGEDTSISCIPKALLLFNPIFDNGPDGFAHELVQPYWKAISPIDHIDDQTPPAMVLLGTEDIHVPVETAKRLERLMKKNGRRCDLHIYEGKKHGWYNLWVSRNDMADSLIRMDRFLTSLGFLDGEPVLTLND